MYGRNYQPTFTRTSEQYLAMIEEMIIDKEYCILLNDAPYNIYSKRTGQVEVETRHFTMYYKSRDCREVRKEVARWLDRGYSIQEVSDDLKSVSLPHIHFIKQINDLG